MQEARKIKAVFFDLDNTLFPASKFTGLARKKAVRAMVKEGLPLGEKQAFRILQHIVSKYGSNYPHHFDALAATANAREKARVVAAGIAAYHSAKQSMKPHTGAEKAIRALTKRGFKACVMSRGVEVKQWDKLLRLNLHLLFSSVFIVQEKTPRAYASARRKLGLKKGEVVMVGDYPPIDALPAKRAGFLTIRILKGKHAKERFPNAMAPNATIRNFSELGRAIEKLERRN